jgi:glycosyltransferase involved in cell wall biosynthesis
MPTIMNYGKIAFLCTYPPQECGIASFTQDLIYAMSTIGIDDTEVIAVTDVEGLAFDKKVTRIIRKNDQNDYIKIANRINNSKIDLLMIEHEYGIFGGECGKFVLDLVNNLKIPVATTFHTILPEPDEKQKKIISNLAQKSAKVITMAENTRKILQTIYNIEPWKIEVIHHGVPKKVFIPRDDLKRHYGYQSKQIISTFGLIGPGKGIEHGIEAMAKVAKEDSSALYLILGETHPALKNEGIDYRKKLTGLVTNLNLEENVKFINKYLKVEEIIRYLQLTDVYLTPYLGKDQAVSGTLAYAVGYGKAIVSTPYLYAKEMLADRRGILAEFKNPASLAAGILQVLKNPHIKLKMERDTMRIGRTMYWDKIAHRYVGVLLKIINNAATKVGVI